MQLLLLIFILIPIIEIAVFIQVGDLLGLGATLAVVFITAIIGVRLLKQQGLRTWQEVQQTTAKGQVPATEMASAAQLLFAGGLLLTPGFVTDAIGFALMVPAVRLSIAKLMMARWSGNFTTASHTSTNWGEQENIKPSHHTSSTSRGRIIEGKVEDD